MLAYFAWHGVLGNMLYSGLVRPFTGYLPTSGIPFSTALAWWRLGELTGTEASPYFVFDYWHMLQQGQLPGPEWYRAWWLAGEVASRLLYTSVPVAFAWALLRRLRSRPGAEGRSGRLLLFAWLALAVVASAFPRADSFHVFSVLPVVFLLLFGLLEPRAGRALSAARLGLEASAVALLLLVCGAVALQHRSFLTHRVALERAEVWVDPADSWIEPLVEYVSAYVGPREPIFVYGHEAQLYFLTGRFYPWAFSQLYPGQAGGDGGKRLVARLNHRPPRLVLRGVLNWPGVPDLVEYAPHLFLEIFERYEPDADFFVAHPVPAGEAPPDWLISVMRPKKTPRGGA